MKPEETPEAQPQVPAGSTVVNIGMMISPIPTQFTWQCDPSGEPVPISLLVSTPTGVQCYLLDARVAEELAAGLQAMATQARSGLVVAQLFEPNGEGKRP